MLCVHYFWAGYLSLTAKKNPPLYTGPYWNCSFHPQLNMSCFNVHPYFCLSHWLPLKNKRFEQQVDGASWLLYTCIIVLVYKINAYTSPLTFKMRQYTHIYTQLGGWVKTSPKCSSCTPQELHFGLQWSGFIKSSARKEQWWTRDKVMDGRGSLMHMGSEDCSEWSDPTDEILKLKLWNKWMLVLIKKKSQNTQCITLCCVWGWIAADQLGCPCWTSVHCRKRQQRASEHQN